MINNIVSFRGEQYKNNARSIYPIFYSNYNMKSEMGRDFLDRQYLLIVTFLVILHFALLDVGDTLPSPFV